VVAEGGACIVASGPAEVFQRVKPYLDAMARVAVHAGEAEQSRSRLVKLCHNLYLGMMVQVLVEVTSPGREGRHGPGRAPGVPVRHRGGFGLGAQAQARGAGPDQEV
jgi:hypothetical protein